MRAPIALYRVRLGSLLRGRFVLLEHRGRSSGLVRQTVLEVLESSEDDSVVIASGFGEASQWCKNISADPDVWFTRGRRRIHALAERLDHEHAVEVFGRYRVSHPRAANMIGSKIGVSLVDDLDNAAEKLPLFRLTPILDA